VSTWHYPPTREDWLTIRARDITATEVPALFGVSPYTTPFELFHRKHGNIHVEIEENERMKWGTRLESAIARGICEDNGWTIIDGGRFIYINDCGLGCSPDYIVEDATGRRGILEVKNVDWLAHKRSWDEEEAPPHIEFQLQTQLELSEFEWGAIGALIGGNEPRVIMRDRDIGVGKAIRSRVAEFWSRTEPYPADYLADADTIKLLYKHAEVGKVKDVDAIGSALIEASRNAKLAAKIAKEDADRTSAELLEWIGDAETVMGDGKIAVRASTVHVKGRTQEVKPYSFRRVDIK